jgi:FixJ family two-component response regulator
MADIAKRVVAVIEDDLDVLESLENLLLSSGYEVRPYRSAESFLQADAEVDCIISDIGMIGMDGIELQRRLCSLKPDLPVILITGRYDAGVPGVSMPNNHGFFRKPVDVYELIRAVAEAVEPKT